MWSKGILPDPVLISGKQDLFQKLCFSGPSGKPEDAAGDRELLEPSLELLNKKSKKKQKGTNNPQSEKPEENESDQAAGFRY